MASRKRKKKSSKLVELSSLVLLSFSIILMLGVVTGDQYLGALGQRITEGLVQLVGYPFIIVPLLMGAWGVAFLLRKDKRKLAVATAYGLGGMVFFALTISFIALEWAWAEETGFAWGGIFGRYLAERCQENLGVGGTIIGLLTIVAMLVIHITDLRLVQLLQFLERVATLLKRGLVGVAGLVKNGLTWCGGRLAQSFAKIREQLQKSGSKPKKTKTTEPADIEEDIPQIREEASDPIDREWLEDAGEEEQTDFEFIDHALAAEEYQDEATEPGEDEEPAEYQFPPIELLNPPPAETVKVSKEDCMALASVIEEKLGDFGVKARVVKVTPGPVITLYEVNPAPGVKISRIENLRDDLALALKADGLRIIAPIPGKDVVGIEVPNQVRETVYLRSVLHSEAFREADSKLTIVLGKTIDGQVYTADIAKMPHLLIAGATGQGKSVCINMILACILYRALPEEVQLVLIDPKRIELSLYRQLKQHHLLRCAGLDEDVITNTDNAKRVLRGLEREMDERYQILQRARVKDIKEYNIKVEQGRFEELDMTKRLPYILVVVDELADLMMTGGKEVEDPIARRFHGRSAFTWCWQPSGRRWMWSPALSKPISPRGLPLKLHSGTTVALFWIKTAPTNCWAMAICSTCRRGKRQSVSRARFSLPMKLRTSWRIFTGSHGLKNPFWPCPTSLPAVIPPAAAAVVPMTRINSFTKL